MPASVLEELEALGSAQTRKTYRRHGAGENVYGVSYADLYKLQKRIKKDHALAQTLWASGNHDARILALMIADPAAADDALLDAWALDLQNYIEADALAGYVAKTALARAKMEAWTESENEWIGTAGWDLLGAIAQNDATLPDAYFLPYLEIIAQTIHARKNRVRYAMNNALIAIGVRNPALEAAALDVATRIGKVEVDHGATNCKTPDATAYIRKTLDRRAAKAHR